MKGRAVLVLVLGLAFLMPALVSAQPWTAAGVTAVVDPIYRDAYKLRIGDPSYLAFADYTEAFEIKALFNVTDTTATGSPAWNTLEMTAFDNFSNNHVRATLYRTEKCTGRTTALCSVTSQNSSSPACGQCTFTSPIDFFNNSYFVHVELIRGLKGTDLRLYSLRVY